ncbi:hypothetical protein BH23GEM6_BH23GEM6_21080 [soil metagenome]
MKRLFGVALLAVLAVAPLALEAQTTGASPDHAGVRMGQPFGMMMRHSTELGLTADQIARIEAIGSRLRSQNAPLMEQMRAGRAVEGSRAEARGGQTPQLSPQQRQQIRQRAANMTPEQRETLRAQMEERRASVSPEDRAAMRARMEERRQQLRDRAGIRGQRGEPRVREVPAELRAAAEQIRANRQAAMHEVRLVLTQEQQGRLQELAQQRRGMALERMQRRQISPNRR